MLYFAIKNMRRHFYFGHRRLKTLKFLDFVGFRWVPKVTGSSEKFHPVIETWQAAVHWMLPVGFARLKSNISMKSEERNNIFL